jgi:hypothetical protein
VEPPTPEPPDPTPPTSGDVPPVGQAVDTNEVLRLGGPTGYQTNGGEAVVPFGVEACCESWAKCPDNQGAPKGTGWPVVSACFVKETGKYGANIYHLRLAPWDSRCEDWSNPHCGEPYWFGIGGTYNVDGSFNMTYAAKVRELVWQISEAGGWAEIVIGDDWWFKNACGKDKPTCSKVLPISDAAVEAWGNTWHPEHDALFKHWVTQLGPFGRVIWATGNEEDLIPGTTGEHIQARVDALRKYEQQVGAQIVHLIGTGSWKPGVSADYQITHDRAPVTGACNGRPCVNNEHNPEFTPEQEANYYATAVAKGQRYDAWRGGASDAEWEKRLQLFSEIHKGGSPAVGCFVPDGDDPNWIEPPVCGADNNTEHCPPGVARIAPTTTGIMNQAKAAVGDRCGFTGPTAEDPGNPHAQQEETLRLLAAKVRELGGCATGPWTDALAIKRSDGKTDEMHAVAFNTGCWAGSPHKFVWSYAGSTGGGPVAGCSDPVPEALHTFNLKLEPTSWYSGTPIVKGHEYCVAIGMGTMPDGVQPRNECPCRNECPGFKCQERAACERHVMGGLATWNSDGETIVDTNNENHLNAKCRNCTWIEVCDAAGAKCERKVTK